MTGSKISAQSRRQPRRAILVSGLPLELFNAEYRRQDAAMVARTGLEKMPAIVAAI
jgi:hypothetical protein